MGEHAAAHLAGKHRALVQEVSPVTFVNTILAMAITALAVNTVRSHLVDTQDASVRQVCIREDTRVLIVMNAFPLSYIGIVCMEIVQIFPADITARVTAAGRVQNVRRISTNVQVTAIFAKTMGHVYTIKDHFLAIVCHLLLVVYAKQKSICVIQIHAEIGADVICREMTIRAPV